MTWRFRIGVADRKQAEAAQRGGFCAFSHGRESAARKLSPGEGFVYYAPRTDFDDAPVQAFVSLGHVTDLEPAERVLPGADSRPWTRGAQYEDIAEMPIRPLPGSLSFIRSIDHCGMVFRRSLFEIPATDFNLIASAMKGS